MTTRIGIGLDYPEFRARGWHGPGVLGPFGAAAAVGRLLGFDAETMARAFGLAGSQAAGTFAAWGTPTVKFHQCRGALSGLMAALLARAEVRGDARVPHRQGRRALQHLLERRQARVAVADLGKRWELEQIALRLWPSASLIQGMITAMFEILAKQHDRPGARCKTVRVTLPQMAFDMHGKLPRYKGKFEALLSTHYTAAVILHDRALTLAQFEPARYDDPKLRKFAAQQVVAKLDPSLTIVQTVVDIEMTDGKVHALRSDHSKGSHENPLTREEVEDKFRIYAKGVLPAPRSRRSSPRSTRSSSLPSVSALMDVLSPAARRDAA